MAKSAHVAFDDAIAQAADQDEARVLADISGDTFEQTASVKPSREVYHGRSTRLGTQKATPVTPEQRRKAKSVADKNRELPENEKTTGLVRDFKDAKKKPQSARSAHLKQKRAVITADAHDLPGNVTSAQARGALGKRRIGSSRHMQ
ncbi:MAG TPA: hypothetical protein VIN59_00245 [Alphaproteobacteria bacterium]